MNCIPASFVVTCIKTLALLGNKMSGLGAKRFSASETWCIVEHDKVKFWRTSNTNVTLGKVYVIKHSHGLNVKTKSFIGQNLYCFTLRPWIFASWYVYVVKIWADRGYHPFSKVHSFINTAFVKVITKYFEVDKYHLMNRPSKQSQVYVNMTSETFLEIKIFVYQTNALCHYMDNHISLGTSFSRPFYTTPASVCITTTLIWSQMNCERDVHGHYYGTKWLTVVSDILTIILP